MQNLVKERIAKVREEIAQISEANRLYLQGGKKLHGAAGDHERRLQRLQEILDQFLPRMRRFVPRDASLGTICLKGSAVAEMLPV